MSADALTLLADLLKMQREAVAEASARAAEARLVAYMTEVADFFSNLDARNAALALPYRYAGDEKNRDMKAFALDEGGAYFETGPYELRECIRPPVRFASEVFGDKRFAAQFRLRFDCQMTKHRQRPWELV